MTVQLEEDDIKRARDFAKKINTQKDQSEKDFGRRDLPRDWVDRTADTFEGKLAEIAFSKFLVERSGLLFHPDFEIYEGQLNHDSGQDLAELEYEGKRWSCTKKVDIKATRFYSKWLLVEKHKFTADAYILVKVKLDRKIEQDIARLENIKTVQCEIAGFILRTDMMFPDGRHWFKWKKGSTLIDFSQFKKPNVTTREQLESWFRGVKDQTREQKVWLKANENYGMPVHWLSRSDKKWGEFFSWVKGALVEDAKLG